MLNELETGMNGGRTRHLRDPEPESLASRMGIDLRKWRDLIEADKQKYPKLYEGSEAQQRQRLGLA